MCRCLKIALFLCFAAIIVFVVHSLLFERIGKYIYEKDALRPADVIVVLAGKENERVEHAVDLFKKEWARKDRIIMSGGPLVWKYTAAALMKRQAESLGIPGKDILLEDRSETTVQQAEYTRQIIREHGYKSMILVTSPYQSRRAAVIFRRVMGERVRVICSPADGGWFRFDGWWKRPRERDIVLEEYTKFFRFWVFGIRQSGRV